LFSPSPLSLTVHSCTKQPINTLDSSFTTILVRYAFLLSETCGRHNSTTCTFKRA
jgi:hypothetical protein